MSNSVIKISNKTLYAAVYGFLYINIFVFLLGFLKWYIAIPAVIACAAALWLAIKSIPESYMEISRTMLIAAIAVISVMLLAAGHGCLCPQLNDWNARNAITNDLINRPWPVYYNNGSALVYYLGYFLMPGAVGKLIGFKAACWIIFLYGVFGMLITYLLLLKILKASDFRRQILVLIILFLFSNCEDIKNIIYNITEGVIKLFNPSYGRPFIMIGYTPFYEMYAGAFNQIIPAFAVLAMFFDDNKILKNIAVAAVPLIIYSPFQIIFIFLITIIAIVRLIVSESPAKAARQVFTPQNIIVLVVLAPLLIMYLWGNVAGDKPSELAFHRIIYGAENIYIYLLFILSQVIIYSAFLYKRNKQDPYFWASTVTLIILPLFQMGLYNDLCTRTSSAALFVIMIEIIDFWFHADMKIKTDKICAVTLAALVGISAVKPAWEMASAIRGGAENFAKMQTDSNLYMPFQSLEDIGPEEGSDMHYNFFAYNAKDTVFFKYMTKR